MEGFARYARYGRHTKPTPQDPQNPSKPTPPTQQTPHTHKNTNLSHPTRPANPKKPHKTPTSLTISTTPKKYCNIKPPMPQTLITGDIHAMYDRLIETLENARFNPEEDTLYAVGDFCDRGPDPVKVIDYLMGLPHFLPVAGNHDMWLYEYLCGQGPTPIWLDPRNGGSVTYQAFRDLPEERKTKIRIWLGDLPLVRTAGNNIILHAGPPSEVQDQATLIAQTQGLTLSKAYEEKLATGSYSPLVHGIVWDRTYIRAAAGWEHFKDTEDAQELGRRPFDTDMTIICGHTPMREILHSDRYHITCIDTGSFDPDGHITVINLPA